MLRDIDSLEAGEAAHADIVKLREQEGVNEVPAIDGELRIIDCFLRDLEPGGPGTEKATAASPIEFYLRFARASYQQRQIGAKEIMPLYHIGVSFFDHCRHALERGTLRLLWVSWINDDQFFPAGIV